MASLLLERREAFPTIVENDLARRWYALPPDTFLPLTNGETCQLLYAGRPGGPQGPDVRDAVLQFARGRGMEQGGGYIVGDVEFHVRCSDWYGHGHHTDVRYNNVALHVVLIYDVAGPILRQDGCAVPVCSLNDLTPTMFQERVQALWPCQCIVPAMSVEERVSLLEHAGMLRFEQKAQALLASLRNARPCEPFSAYDVCLVPALAEALGYGRDRAFFRAAGMRLIGLAGPVPEPLGHTAKPSPLDAGRLRVLGALVEQWRVRGAWEMMRRVIVRIERPIETWRPQGAWRPDETGQPREAWRPDETGRPQGSPLLYTADEQPTSYSRGDPCGRPGPYVHAYGGNPYDSHFDNLRTLFPGLSSTRADIIICNVVLPFAAAVAYLEDDYILMERTRQFYRTYPGLVSNQVTRAMCRQLGLEREPRSACQQQGLHYVYAQTCREKRCGECLVVRREQ